MTHKGIQENTDYEKNVKPYVKLHTATLSDIAEIERAKAKKSISSGNDNNTDVSDSGANRYADIKW